MPELLHKIFKKMKLILMARRIEVSASKHQLKLFHGNRLIKAYQFQLGKYCHQHLLGHTRLSINNSIHPRDLECFRWDCQNLITVYTEQITQLQSVRMYHMDVLECLTMMI